MARPSMRETLECCPIAYATFRGAAVLFTAFNFGSYLAATVSHPLYTEWLNYSRPFTDLTAGLFSTATNPAADHLQRQHATYLIPLIRNILAINFAFLIFAPVCVAIGVLVDILRNFGKVRSGIFVLSTKVKVTFPNLVVRCTILLLPAFCLTYFGGIQTYAAVSLLAGIIVYYVMFGGIMLGSILAIYFIIRWLILKNSVSVKMTDKPGCTANGQ